LTSSLWAISDLHLAFGRPDEAGPDPRLTRWRDEARLIERNWRAAVGPADVVLLPGDISRARDHREVQPDLSWLERLPGTKVLAPGNHDRWFNKVAKVRPLLRPSQRAVSGDAIDLDGRLIVAGTRGADPLVEDAPPSQRATLDREVAALDAALAAAGALRADPATPLVVLWHHPPFDAFGRPGPAVERLERAGVTACLYGHLHARSQWGLAVQGVVRGVRYSCVAADAVGFRPLRIDLA
jgi:predicted phosphohydrolase